MRAGGFCKASTAECTPGAYKFHSQLREDEDTLRHFFSDKKWEGTGTFVELGGRDGLMHSNTLFYERCLGWRGVLFEAKPGEFAMV